MLSSWGLLAWVLAELRGSETDVKWADTREGASTNNMLDKSKRGLFITACKSALAEMHTKRH
jgi:hypothetical protein